MCWRLPIPILVALALAACSVPSYPPPPQRQFPEADDPLPPVTYLPMGAGESSDHVIADINDFVEGVGWRWTHQHPRMRFRLPQTTGWKFSADFGLPLDTFKDTGPVTVSFVVQGHLLAKVRYDTPGDKHFEKPVPEAWLRAGEDIIAGADIDPPWIAPVDKAPLGFVLHGAGFIR